MKIEINLKKLDDDEFYQLHQALKSIKKPNTYVKEALKAMDEKSRKDYDKLCRERGWSMMLK